MKYFEAKIMIAVVDSMDVVALRPTQILKGLAVRTDQEKGTYSVDSNIVCMVYPYVFGNKAGDMALPLEDKPRELLQEANDSD